MAIQQRIISKTIGQSCIGAKFKGFHSPKLAQTFDTVTGVCKKGNFEITSFRDDANVTIKKVQRYVDENDNETIIIKNWNKDRNHIYTATAKNGVVKELVHQMLGGRKDALLIFEQKLVHSEYGDIVDLHSIKACKKGEKPREISYIAKWDGKSPDIRYKNTVGKFSEGERLEYLPMWQPEMALPRYNHITKFNRMRMGLDDILPPFEFASLAELNHGIASFDEAKQVNGILSLGATSPYTGLVQIAKAADSNFDIIDILAHEHRHAFEFSMMNRLQYNVDSYHKLKEKMFTPEVLNELKKNNPSGYELVKMMIDFNEKAIAKGILTRKRNGEEYRYFKWLDKRFNHKQYVNTTQTLKGHDEHPLERGPLNAGKKATDEYLQLRDAIFRVLGVK